MATIATVVPDTPITSAWGNSVANELNNNCAKKSGATFTGAVLLPSPQSTNPAAAVRYDYISANSVNRAGSTMTGALIVGSDPDNWEGVRLRPDGVIESTLLGNTAGGNSGALSTNIELVRASPPVSGADSPFVAFRRSAGGVTASTQIGSITVASSSSVAYNTTSDQRLKERTGDAADASTIVAGLGRLVYRGRWIADQGQGDEWVFLNSQDVAPVAPFAVSGSGTAVDGEGKPIPQQLNHDALVPMLFAALSQAIDRIATLEAAR